MAKHRSGYDILKGKIAKLENDAAFYKAQYREVCKERDEWKSRCGNAELENKGLCYSIQTWRQMFKDERKKKSFLLDHCPFWVKWKYRKQFKEGGDA